MTEKFTIGQIVEKLSVQSDELSQKAAKALEWCMNRINNFDARHDELEAQYKKFRDERDGLEHENNKLRRVNAELQETDLAKRNRELEKLVNDLQEKYEYEGDGY